MKNLLLLTPLPHCVSYMICIGNFQHNRVEQRENPTYSLGIYVLSSNEIHSNFGTGNTVRVIFVLKSYGGSSPHNQQKVYEYKQVTSTIYTLEMSAQKIYGCSFTLYQPTVMLPSRNTFGCFCEASINCCIICDTACSYGLPCGGQQRYVSLWNNEFVGIIYCLQKLYFFLELLQVKNTR